MIPWAILTLALTIAQISTVLLEPRVWTLPYLTVQGFRHVKCSQERLASANTPERLRIFLKERPHVGPFHRSPVGAFVPGIVSRDGSVVGGRANCDGGGRRLLGSIVGSTGVKNASPWADFPPKAMSPFAVETRSPGRNVGSFFTPSGAKPKGSLPLQVQFATSSLR